MMNKYTLLLIVFSILIMYIDYHTLQEMVPVLMLSYITKLKEEAA